MAIFATAVAGVWWPGSLRDLPSLGVFGMAFFGTIYSAYLTWLELYRIEAVCMWCTISAVLLTAILFISVINVVVRAGLRPATPGRGHLSNRGAGTNHTAQVGS
jgi:uncharacterized membrane protein